MPRSHICAVLFCVLATVGCQTGADNTVPAIAAASTPTLPQIEPVLKRLALQDGAEDSTAEMRLSVEMPGGRRDQLDFRLQRKYSDAETSTLLIVTAPREESDKALLAIERPDQPTAAFSYLAGLKRVARLASSNTLTFRQTKVTVQELLNLELAQYRSTGGERIVDGDEPLLKYTLEAPPERTMAYRKVIASFRETDLAPVKFELYDERDQLQKSVQVEEVRQIEGRQTIMRLSIDDQTQNRRLRLETRDLKYNRRLPAKLFTEANLIEWTSSASQRLLESR